LEKKDHGVTAYNRRILSRVAHELDVSEELLLRVGESGQKVPVSRGPGRGRGMKPGGRVQKEARHVRARKE